jgi:hypothetical protein
MRPPARGFGEPVPESSSCSSKLKARRCALHLHHLHHLQGTELLRHTTHDTIDARRGVAHLELKGRMRENQSGSRKGRAAQDVLVIN